MRFGSAADGMFSERINGWGNLNLKSFIFTLFKLNYGTLRININFLIYKQGNYYACSLLVSYWLRAYPLLCQVYPANEDVWDMLGNAPGVSSRYLSGFFLLSLFSFQGLEGGIHTTIYKFASVSPFPFQHFLEGRPEPLGTFSDVFRLMCNLTFPQSSVLFC